MSAPAHDLAPLLRYCLFYITLQHTATYCNTLDSSCVCAGTRSRFNALVLPCLQHTATYCNTLQHIGILPMSAPAQKLAPMLSYCLFYNTLQQTATRCNTLEFYLCLHQNKTSLQCFGTAFFTTYCNILQHTATYCNILQHAEILPVSAPAQDLAPMLWHCLLLNAQLIYPVSLLAPLTAVCVAACSSV